MNSLFLSLFALAASFLSFILVFLINKETKEIRELDKKALRIKLDMYKYLLETLESLKTKLDNIDSRI